MILFTNEERFDMKDKILGYPFTSSFIRNRGLIGFH